MIVAIRRNLARQRRAKARRPLAQLLRAAAAHAIAPLTGRPVTLDLMQAASALASGGIRRLADARALAYFGIHSAADLGVPPVALYLVSDGRGPFGRVDLDVTPLVSLIFAGGARAAGWRSPDQLTTVDLA